MSDRKDGGPAFPISDGQTVHRVGAAAIEGVSDVAERDRIYTQATATAASGMTLRDYFAAKALVIIAAAGGIDHIGPGECASAAYEIADAMLAERAK